MDKIKDKAKYHLMDGERYILSDFQPVDVVRKPESNIIPVIVPRGRPR